MCTSDACSRSQGRGFKLQLSVSAVTASGVFFLEWILEFREGTRSSGEMVCPPFPAKGIPIPLHIRDSVVIIHNKKNAYTSLRNSCSSSHFISTLVCKLETALGMFFRTGFAVGAWSAAGLLAVFALPQSCWLVLDQTSQQRNVHFVFSLPVTSGPCRRSS